MTENRDKPHGKSLRAEACDKPQEKAAFIQMQVLRAMTMEQRWRVAQNLYATAREWKASAVRALHPEWTDADVLDAVRRSFLHVGR